MRSNRYQRKFAVRYQPFYLPQESFRAQELNFLAWCEYESAQEFSLQENSTAVGVLQYMGGPWKQKCLTPIRKCG
jgi:hypothetical protein